MKTLCPAGCGKKFISKEHSEKHADENHIGWREPKQKTSKGWCTPYGFIDFSSPVTYEHACKIMKEIGEKYVKGN